MLLLVKLRKKSANKMLIKHLKFKPNMSVTSIATRIDS